MSGLSRFSCVLMGLSGIVAAATPAQAVNTSFALSGICLDCTPNQPGDPTPVSGLLVLSDYTLGDAFSISNFVSFSYSSAKYPSFALDATQVYALVGAIMGDGANQVRLDAHIGDDPLTWETWEFATNDASANGAFNLNRIFPEDVGIAAEWTQVQFQSDVPEPAAWALMVLGFGVAGAALRRRRAVAVAIA
jgi:hypothetical protein